MTRRPGTVTFRWPSGTPFDSGAQCLDLVYTGGPGDLAKWEQLSTPGDLRVWARDGPMGLPIASVQTADLLAAHELREHLRGLLQAAARPATLPPRAVTAVNAAAAAPPPVPKLGRDGTVGWAGPISTTSVLSLLARDAIEVVRGSGGGRLKECAAPDCPLLFVDDSRAGTRRWCSMQRCGNRSKVRAQRART
jgi:predicted RNA-binding Zn ribbon-like protein